MGLQTSSWHLLKRHRARRAWLCHTGPQRQLNVDFAYVSPA
jgi:hypothetical protein